jgi:hypothetical protein
MSVESKIRRIQCVSNNVQGNISRYGKILKDPKKQGGGLVK